MSKMPRKTRMIAYDMCNLEGVRAHYYNTFLELAVNRFRWKGLPENIDARYLEFYLTRNGAIDFVWDDVLQEFNAFMCTWTGFDDYYNPTDFHIVLPTGRNIDANTYDSVIIWNNFMRISDIPTINMFADAITNIFVSAMVNVNAQKTPVAMLADSEKEKLTIENAYMQWQGNRPVIWVKDKNVLDAFQVIKTDAPFVAPELMNLKDRIMEEFLKWLGVKVPLTNGRERLIVNEQADANAVTFQLRNRGLHSRQIACEQINKKFGLNLSVEFNEDLGSLVDGMLPESKPAPTEGGEE